MEVLASVIQAPIFVDPNWNGLPSYAVGLYVCTGCMRTGCRTCCRRKGVALVHYGITLIYALFDSFIPSMGELW